jgi:hypothetical protein
MALRQYDPAKVLITLGNDLLSGYADGTFLNVEQNEDSYTLQMGTDGEGTRTRTNNESARITVTLMQSSASNDVLSALHELDKAIGFGAGCVPLLIKDFSGRSIFSAEKAWIVKPPSSEFGREATGREWMIETDKLIGFTAGN